MEYPKLVEGVKEHYIFNETLNRRCILSDEGNSDYSIAHTYFKSYMESPCSCINCGNCVFGMIDTLERLREARNYWNNEEVLLI